ncbi:hypothetical protein ACRQ5Q_14620 [Bradyrhizobium sp. PMVTL-01]|uniref:hypothetical protein n=1 Tax=Bradyrhizobium sp. PMVTL-01 TaxID=3434999 RepID=UPI003F71C441
MSIRTLRAILIDPFACEVRELQLPYSDLRSVYAQLSHETMPVDMAQLVVLSSADDLYVDEDGLTKGCERYFRIAGYQQALAGKGIILGHSNSEADHAATTRQWVEERVTFFEVFVGGILLPTDSPWRRRY